MELDAIFETTTETKNIIVPQSPPSWQRGEKSFRLADEAVRAVAQRIIDAVDQHKHLREAKILLLMQTGLKANADGLLELGKARKATPFLAMLAGEPDFVVSVNAEAWERAVEDGDRRLQAAIIDHELMHCGATIAGRFVAAKKVMSFAAALGPDHIETCNDITDDKGRILVRYYKRTGPIKPGKEGYSDQPPAWRLRKHDVQDFTDVVARWGAWTNIHRRLIDVLEKSKPRRSKAG